MPASDNGEHIQRARKSLFRTHTYAIPQARRISHITPPARVSHRAMRKLRAVPHPRFAVVRSWSGEFVASAGSGSAWKFFGCDPGPVEGASGRRLYLDAKQR
jgi:hypothetical protein